jgi:hypothetical protein
MLNWWPATLLKVLFEAWRLEVFIIVEVKMKDDKRPACGLIRVRTLVLGC